jgi:hypothetical protein
MINFILNLTNDILHRMNKFLFGEKGISIQTGEQKNVLAPYSAGFLYVAGVVIVFLLCGFHIIAVSIFGVYLLFFIILNVYFAFTKPELLQSEKYRIEMRKIAVSQEAKEEIKNHTDIRVNQKNETITLPLLNDKEDV